MEEDRTLHPKIDRHKYDEDIAERMTGGARVDRPCETRDAWQRSVASRIDARTGAAHNPARDVRPAEPYSLTDRVLSRIRARVEVRTNTSEQARANRDTTSLEQEKDGAESADVATDVERRRAIEQLREERHDARAKTVCAGVYAERRQGRVTDDLRRRWDALKEEWDAIHALAKRKQGRRSKTKS